MRISYIESKVNHLHESSLNLIFTLFSFFFFAGIILSVIILIIFVRKNKIDVLSALTKN